MSPPVSHEILGVFVYTLTSDGKYPIQDCENLQLPIQMELSEKPKTFSQYCVPFLESISNFKSYKKKKMIIIANVFQKLKSGRIFLRTLSKKPRFRTRFEGQHVKASQMLAKSQ